MTTLGTTFEVISPDLTDPADITVAFKEFYEGVGATSGVEDHLEYLDGRLTTLELNPPNVEFLSNSFRIKDNGDTTKKVSFGLSGITTNTTATLTVTTSGEIVLKDATQSLQNKTLNTTNTIQSDWNKFTLAKMNGGSPQYELKFDVSAITSNKTMTIPDFTSPGTLVLTTTDQTLTNKTFGGYKELYPSTLTALDVQNNVEVSSYNLIFASPAPTANLQQMIINANMTNGASVFIIIKGNATYSVIPKIRVNGSSVSSNIKWAGGTVPPTIAANATLRHSLISITRLGDTNFGTYLGEYYG